MRNGSHKGMARDEWANILEKAEEDRCICGIWGYYKLRIETIERDFVLAKKLHGLRSSSTIKAARCA